MANGQWGGLRTIVSEEAVTQLVEKHFETYPRLREAWDALEWMLARAGERIGRPPQNGDDTLRLYVQAGDVLANVPSIWVLYRLGVEIEILAAHIAAPVEDEEE